MDYPDAKLKAFENKPECRVLTEHRGSFNVLNMLSTVWTEAS